MSVLVSLLRRILLWSVIGLALLVVLWIVFCTEERWRGKRAWNGYRSAALSRGIKLDTADLPHNPIPDSENFAAAPIIQKLFTEDEDATSNPKWFAALKMEGYRKPPPTGSRQEMFTHLDSWRDHFVAQGVIPEATDNVAVDMLGAFKAVESELDQLRGAGDRPKSKFPINPELGVEAPQPHLVPLLKAAQVYQIMIAAQLANGDSAAAYKTARELMRLHAALRDEPTLIAGLIRVTIVALLDAAVRDGLLSDRWSKEELQRLFEDYARFDWLEECRHTLSTERMLMNKTSELQEGRSTSEFVQKYSPLGLWGPWSTNPTLLRAALIVYPSGWLSLSQVKINEYFDRQIARVDSLKTRAFADTIGEEDELVDLGNASLVRRVPYWNALSSISSIQGTVDRYVQIIAQTTITQAALQIARYRQKEGAYPTTLDSLVPEYLPEIPRDPMDLAPIRYRPKESAYDLWSIALDCIDDGGESIPGTKWSEQPDWVFQR